jgi:hypothetical protein
MTFVTKELTGTAFAEIEKHTENPNFPTHTGKAMVDGKLYAVSVWQKDEVGETVEVVLPGRLSLSFREWVERTPEAPTADLQFSSPKRK